MKQITAKKIWQKGSYYLNTWLGKNFLLPQAENLFEYRHYYDIIIILDGCRYDTFKKINFLDGTLSKKILHGTCTPEWAEHSIVEQYHDLVYVSANPFVSHFYLEQWQQKNAFYHLEELWDSGWDQKRRTVPAPTVTKAGLKMLQKYPDKTLVLHYMQPHHPFIGKTKIKEYGWVPLGTKQESDGDYTHVYQLLEQGKVTKKHVLQAYEDNLRYVLKAVQPLLKAAANQRILITSDHGNCFGEHGLYGHPEATYVRPLLEVPWFEINN